MMEAKYSTQKRGKRRIRRGKVKKGNVWADGRIMRKKEKATKREVRL